MTAGEDRALLALIGGVVALLIAASVTGWILSRAVASDRHRDTIENANARIRAWWVMAALFVGALVTGRTGAVLQFTLVSFLALREFVTLVPTHRADHRALFWCFFVITPLQYALIWAQWYGLFSILVPVYVSIFLAIRTAAAGDTERFLERTATTQWGLLICVYFVGYVPALLMLHIPGYEGQNAKLVFFLVLVVQLSDVLQYLWGKSIGAHPVAPRISPNKTWEGLVGGIASATLVGTAIWWATPFTPAEAALMSFIAALMGFAGGIVMSAIKRDVGVKDYGSSISGHGGILDRVDSLCFAAPVFFHLTRYFHVP